SRGPGTPLTSVWGFAELVLLETPPGDPRRGLLKMAHNGAQQLNRLIEDLLDASRIETGRMRIEPVAVDPATVVPAVLGALRSTSERHALVERVVADARWVRADPDRLRQVLTNLVGNAIKY